jgi:hypothetical protein
MKHLLTLFVAFFVLSTSAQVKTKNTFDPSNAREGEGV